MRKFFLLSFAASLVLAASAVWLGGLNQDEGWYLYAAQMVGEGKMLYRDFAYTQGPLMPIVYSAFSWVWKAWGLLGARILTVLTGFAGILFAVAVVRKTVPRQCAPFAMFAVFALLGCNLYHLYYLAIPKTYAIASLFVMLGFYLLLLSEQRRYCVVPAAISLAFAAGVRISLAMILLVVGFSMLIRRRWMDAVLFAAGASAALLLVYGPFVFDDAAREGLLAAQRYHAERGGGDIVWVVGSLSRLVRWYLPVFVLFGMGFAARTTPFVNVMGMSFAAVFAVQMLAPFPYEDYQVPIMALFSIFAVAKFSGSQNQPDCSFSRKALLVLGLSFACSFASPMLEKWSVNGQDRFWARKKQKCELEQLRDVARRIEQMDPGGKELLTQDLYLAIETDRRVPAGLEMGPFAMLDDAAWRRLLENSPCRIAALSGYTFAIEPPRCSERPIEKQMEYWGILKKRYRLAWTEDDFGQNSTTLIVLEKND